MDKIAEGFKGEKAIVTPYSIRNFQAKNELTRQLFVTHIGYYPKAKLHFRDRPQGTYENIIIYCDDGKGWITLGNEKYFLQKNQAFIIPANQAHTYGADDLRPWSIYWLHFRGIGVPLFSSIIGKVLTFEEGNQTLQAGRIQLFEEIFQNLEMGYLPDNLEYASICFQHFLASFKYASQFAKTRNTEEDDIIQRSILFMKNNLEKKLTLDDIAQHVGYSSQYFGSLFSAKTSYSPISYYNQLKIQKACSLLQFSDLKIKEIAFQLGYYDPFHFSKAFFHEMEITPREYRKRYKTEKGKKEE